MKIDFSLKKYNLSIKKVIDKSCREEGIRTLVTLLVLTRFPSVRLKPLGHLSINFAQIYSS